MAELSYSVHKLSLQINCNSSDEIFILELCDEYPMIP